MRGICTTLFFIISFFYSLAQSALVDTTEINQLIEVGYSYFENEKIQDSENRADTALVRSRKLNYLKGIGETLLLKGLICKKSGDLFWANQNFQTALIIWDSLGEQLKLAETYFYLAKLKNSLNEFDLGIKYATEAVSVYKDRQNLNGLFEGYATLAMLHQNAGNITETRSIYLEALKQFKGKVDSTKIARLYYDFGDFYYSIDSLNIALNNFNKVLQIQQSDPDYSLLSVTYNGKGNILFDFEKYKKAEEFYQKSIDAGIIANDSMSIFDAYSNLCMLDELKKDYKSYDKHYKAALEYAGDWAGMDEHEYLNGLSKNYLSQKEASEKRKQRIIWILISSLVVALGGVFVGRLRNQKLRKEQLKIMQDHINAFNFNYLEAKLDGEQSERKKIAQNLHDEVGSQVAAIRWLYEENLKKFKVQQLDIESMESVYGMLSKAYFDLRSVVKQLEVEDNDLLEKLQAFCKKINNKNDLTVRFDQYGMEEPLKPSLQSQVSKIIMALISNVLIHAQAKSLSIQINQLKDELNIIIEDNGKGFDVKPNNWGSGLKNVNARIKRLNGNWEINSKNPKGTQITISIPLESG